MSSRDPDLQLIALIEAVAERLRDPGQQRASEQALRSLYDQCSGKLYGVAVKVVRNREWAEDVLQETFLTIWRSAGDYRGSLSPPLAWMGLVVRSRALDFLRRRTAERADAVLELDDAVTETVAGDFDAKHGTLMVKRVMGYQEGAERSLQLWAIPPAGAPRSLGVIAEQPVMRMAAAEQVVGQSPVMAISLEPKGGVPGEGGPTGPVLWKGAVLQAPL
jgi:RNA polymerase sigma factor (sigma-70 family)